LCTGVQQDKKGADMRKVYTYTASPKLVTLSRENNPTVPPPTPGLSVRMASMCVEAEECVCSARCDGDEAYCARGEDECVCTASCEGRGSHAHIQERSEELKLGMKYCPGIEPVLPEYEYVEYKPRTSAKEFTISKYSTTTTQPGGEEKYKTAGEDGTEQSDRRGEGVDTGSVDSFQRREVSNLISEWESRAGGGDGMEKLELPEESIHGRGRRMSQEFKQIRQKFVEGGESTRMKNVTAVKPIPSFATGCNNERKITMQGRGAVRKINFTKYQNMFSSVLGRGGAPLARISANGKRKLDSEECGGGGARRERVVGINLKFWIIDMAWTNPN
jgi:hypothetical protein